MVLTEHKVLLCSTAITQTPVLLLHEDPSLLVAAHRFHRTPIYRQVTSTRVPRGRQVYLSTLFLFFVISKKWLENRRNLVEHMSYEMHPDFAANRNTG